MRPALMNPKHVFLELSHQALTHKNALGGRDTGIRHEDKTAHWSWPPIYKHLPSPQWKGNAVRESTAKPSFRLHRKTDLTSPAATGRSSGLNSPRPSAALVSPLPALRLHPDPLEPRARRTVVSATSC